MLRSDKSVIMLLTFIKVILLKNGVRKVVDSCFWGGNVLLLKRWVIQSGQLSWKRVRLVLGKSGVQISPSLIEFSIGERLRERFYAVCHKIRLRRIKFKILSSHLRHLTLTSPLRNIETLKRKNDSI